MYLYFTISPLCALNSILLQPFCERAGVFACATHDSYEIQLIPSYIFDSHCIHTLVRYKREHGSDPILELLAKIFTLCKFTAKSREKVGKTGEFVTVLMWQFLLNTQIYFQRVLSFFFFCLLLSMKTFSEVYSCCAWDQAEWTQHWMFDDGWAEHQTMKPISKFITNFFWTHTHTSTRKHFTFWHS